MSLFGKAPANVEKPKDILGGGFQTLPSGVYDATVAMAYVSKSSGGAQFIEFEFNLPEGKKHKQTVYVSSGDNKGNKNTYEKNGKEFLLPGYILADEIAAVTTEALLANQDHDMRLVEVYDFDTKQKVQKEFPVLIDMIGKKLKLGIQEIAINKREQQGKKWVDTEETKTINEIDKVFNEDGFTVNELMDGEEEPEFIQKWEDKNSGKLIDKVKKVSTGNSTLSGGAAKSKSSLFNKQ